MPGNRLGRPPTIDLSVLTPRQRLVITLHYFDNWTEQEIADGIGIHQSNVSRAIARACARLRAHISAPIGRA